MAQCSWRKRFFKSCQCIFTMSLLSPIERWTGPSFEQTWIPFHPRMLLSTSWEEDKMWKVYDDDDNVNNDDGQCTNFDQKIRLSWAKNKSANCTLHLILAKQNIVPFKTCSCLDTNFLKLDNWNNIWLSRIVKLTQSP